MIGLCQSGVVESTFKKQNPKVCGFNESFYDLFSLTTDYTLQFIIRNNQSTVCVCYSLSYCGNRDRLWAFTRMTQSQGSINPLVRWLSAETTSTDRHENQKTACFLCYPRSDVSSHSTFQIILLRIVARQISFWFSLEGSLFHKKVIRVPVWPDLALFLAAIFLNERPFASGYCTLIKKAELIVNSGNVRNALCDEKYKSSLLPLFMLANCPLTCDIVRGEFFGIAVRQ